MSQLLGVAAYQISHLKLLSIISVLAADCREYVVIARF
jgi:hypothetical protein